MNRANSNGRTLLFCGFLAAITLMTYWPVVHNDFVSYDDRAYVTENPHVLSGLTQANALWAFRTNHAGNWHPLSWLSHMLDVQLFGLKPWGHHATSVVLHTANTLLLFLLLVRLTGSLWRSAAVSVLFAVHPLHVESVAWVAERKDVLSTFFFLLTLLMYERYARRCEGKLQTPNSKPQENIKLQAAAAAPSRLTDHASRIANLPASIFYLLSLLFFALGLMSKPMLVTVPCVLLLLDYWPLGRLRPVGGKAFASTNWSILAEKVPFLIVSVASSALTFVIQRGAGAVSSLEAVPLEFRISNALISYVRYAAKMFWPVDLAVFYPAPKHWPDLWVVGAVLVLAGVTVMALLRVRQAPYFLVGWLWYAGTLVPVIGIVQVGQQSMADRYTYIPLIGLFVAIVWAAAELAAKWPMGTRALAACGVGLTAACAILTWNQLACWRNSAELFRHAISATSENAVAQNNLGVCLLDAGDLPAAESRFAEAVRIRPRYTEALANLAICREKAGQDQAAIDLLERAVAVQGSAVAHYDLANVLTKQGRLDEAEAHYRAALKAEPEFADAWYNLGVMKEKQGRPEDAAECYTAALKIKPGYPEANLTFGAMLAGRKQFDEAILHFRAAVAAAPTNPDAHFNLAGALNAKGDFAGAASQYAEAMRLRPSDREARQNLGLALLYQGKMPEAAQEFRELLRGQPDANAHYWLALALDSQGQAEEALTHYREAVRLSPNTALYLNDLAWVLAASAKPELRNGAEAVRLAEQACELNGGKEPRFLGTLDAAYAEAGRFDEAIATATKTRERASAAGQADIAAGAEQRLKLYREHKSYRPPAPTENR